MKVGCFGEEGLVAATGCVLGSQMGAWLVMVSSCNEEASSYAYLHTCLQDMRVSCICHVPD